MVAQSVKHLNRPSLEAHQEERCPTWPASREAAAALVAAAPAIQARPIAEVPQLQVLTPDRTHRARTSHQGGRPICHLATLRHQLLSLLRLLPVHHLAQQLWQVGRPGMQQIAAYHLHKLPKQDKLRKRPSPQAHRLKLPTRLVTLQQLVAALQISLPQ